MQQESRDPQITSKVEPSLLPAPPSVPLLAAKAEPPLLPAPPQYLLLGPARHVAPAPEIPLSDLVSVLTQRLLASDPAQLGEALRRCTTDLNQRLTNRDGSRSYFAYPTEALERLQHHLSYQGRSAANADEGQAWRHLSRAFAQAIQQRGEGG
jgi:hypothetical protein